MLLMKASFILDSGFRFKESNVLIAASVVQTVLNLKKKKNWKQYE